MRTRYRQLTADDRNRIQIGLACGDAIDAAHSKGLWRQTVVEYDQNHTGFHHVFARFFDERHEIKPRWLGHGKSVLTPCP